MPLGPVTFPLFFPIAQHRLGMFPAIFTPVIGMPSAPISVGLNIVVAVIGIDRAFGLLPAALAFPLAFIRSAIFLLGGLCSGVEKFMAGATTLLFHTKPLFD